MESNEIKFRASLPLNVADAMRENLPQEIGALLRAQLAAGLDAMELVESQKIRLLELAADNQKHMEYQHHLERFEKERKELEKERAAVEVLKRQQENAKLKHELAVQKEMTFFLQQLTGVLARGKTPAAE